MVLGRLLLGASAESSPSTTVIIPTYNEASCIASTVAAVRARAARRAEVIVVDGHSLDATVRLARAAGATVLCVRGGRAAQLNAGAARAAAPTLLFLHADTLVPVRFDDHISHSLSAPHVVAGAFRLKIDSDLFGIRVVERVANWRASFLQRPYGDQGLFMSSTRFAQLGGYPNMPFLDDYVMVRNIARKGRIAISPAPVITSARRWETLGVFRTTIINQLVIGAFHLGVPVERLRAWYRGTRGSAGKVG